jgi:chromosome segregation ATPase
MDRENYLDKIWWGEKEIKSRKSKIKSGKSFLGDLMKGGNEESNMETKSRYEVIADLEKQKRNLIRERDSLDDDLKVKEKVLKDLKRDIEDTEEEITNFKSKMKDKKQTISELIKSVEQSLDRFAKLGEKNKKS